MIALPRIGAAFLALSLSGSVAAAESIPTPLGELVSKPAMVDASNLIEVLQVLALANASQVESAALVPQRQPDAGLLELADDMRRDLLWMQQTLEVLAYRKDISLQFESLTSTARQVKINVDGDYEVLARTSLDEFRSAFLRVTAYQYQKILNLYDQISQRNQDTDLRSHLTIFRPMIEKNLARIQQH